MFQITVTHTPCLEQIAYCFARSELTFLCSYDSILKALISEVESDGELRMPPWILEGRTPLPSGFLARYEQALVWAKKVFPDAQSYQETDG